MEDMDCKAVQAAKNADLLEKFLRESEPFIMSCAYGAIHRYITKSDDEWSIAYLAFSQAIHDYSIEKGSFSQFAKLVIRRRLTDYFRKQSKFVLETSVNPSVLDSNMDEEDNDDNINIEVKTAIYNHIDQNPEEALKLEIETVNQIFASYGFSFFDLTECSPKAQKTKKVCAKAVIYIIEHPILFNSMKDMKMLPLKRIETEIHLPRKILERHRKYIIAVTEIIAGDYPCLAEYVRFIREELKK